MARRLRIQFPGAFYHVLNRGNYRRDVFESASTAKAFEITLDEACQRHRWRLHAYVVMRNHYHLALETPEPNLIEGMHWLQSTFATRFNRLRGERGHLFQGRYQSLLVEDLAALVQVVNYLHLNPVRAGIVTPAQIAAFRWSSLHRFLRHPRPAWLIGKDWLGQLGYDDSPAGWAKYLGFLGEIDVKPHSQQPLGESSLSKGWAIGTAGWRKAIAKNHAHLRLHAGTAAIELREIKEVRWEEALQEVLREAKKSVSDAQAESKSAPWKIAAAARLRRDFSVPHRRIAEALAMGSPHSVRSYLSRLKSSSINQQTSA